MGASLRGMDRSRIFVVTKLQMPDHGRAGAMAAIDTSLAKLGLDYVDLYLIHNPRVRVGVTTAGEPGCYLVEKHLSRFVEGADPRDVERIWDQMWRATTNYGRKGLPLQAISAVDLAIWDLLGKLRNEPATCCHRCCCPLLLRHRCCQRAWVLV